MIIQITNEKIEQLIKAYKDNKKIIRALNKILNKHGVIDNGLTDIQDTFEMGYNNALEYVFEVLDINVYKTLTRYRKSQS